MSEAKFLRKQLKIQTLKETAFTTMQDVELVLRFLTLEGEWTEFSGDMRRSMDKFMDDNTNLSAPKRKILSHKFSTSLARCQALWGGDSFKRPSTNSTTRDQFLSGLYDAQMISVSSLSEPKYQRILANSAAVRRETKALFKDPKFDEAVRRSTNSPVRVKYRIQKMIDTLESLQK
jgi:hypothetical protein